MILLAAVIFDRYKQKQNGLLNNPQPFSLIPDYRQRRALAIAIKNGDPGHTVYTYMANNPLTTSVALAMKGGEQGG